MVKFRLNFWVVSAVCKVSISHSELEWGFWFGLWLGWHTTHTHCYFTRLNLKKMGPLQCCHLALLGTHRHTIQKEFLKSCEGFLRAALTGHGLLSPFRKIAKMALFDPCMVFEKNLGQMTSFKLLWSFIVWLYPKNISGTVQLRLSAYLRG
jgi:hypothetical protein